MADFGAWADVAEEGMRVWDQHNCEKHTVEQEKESRSCSWDGLPQEVVYTEYGYINVTELHGSALVVTLGMAILKK
jgi:hypothetical protein